MNAPTTPMMMSPTIPPGPSPGTTYFARKPAIRPTISQLRIPMFVFPFPRVTDGPSPRLPPIPSPEQNYRNNAQTVRLLRFQSDMRIITPAAATLAVLAAIAPAAAQTVSPPRPPASIEVSGQGAVDRMPDRVVVSFSVVTNDDVATRATSANNSTYNALVAKLRGLGLDPAAIKTTGYYLSYNRRPPKPDPQFQQRFGYVVTRSVSVTSDRTDQAG